MYKGKKIGVIIPALNEEGSLPIVLEAIPSYVDTVYVTDNGSDDGTFAVISDAARFPRVIPQMEPRRGYGMACMKAMKALKDEEIIVFLDADASDIPGRMDLLLDPIIVNGFDVVISNRITGEIDEGAMTSVQTAGNKLTVFLIRLFWGYQYFDLGPFRSITRDALDNLKMRDPNYGWTVELQIKALQKELRIHQADVSYRKRQRGRSKVSGTIRGSILAGIKILSTVFRLKITGLSWDR